MQALRRNFGGKSAVQAWWRQFGGRLVQARVFLMTVQYSAVTVQYSVYCIVSTQCDQLCVMSVLIVTYSGYFWCARTCLVVIVRDICSKNCSDDSSCLLLKKVKMVP